MPRAPLRHPQPQGPGGRAPPLITFLLDDASPGPWWEEVPGGLAAQKAQHPGPHLACGGVSPGDSLLMIVAERGDCPPSPVPWERGSPRVSLLLPSRLPVAQMAPRPLLAAATWLGLGSPPCGAAGL